MYNTILESTGGLGAAGKGTFMIKTVTALSAAGLLSLAALVSTPARAGDGGAIAAGVLGGIAAGAIIANSSRPAYPNDYYHPGYYGPAYGAPPHRYNQDCWYEQGRYWDQYAGTWRPGPRRLVCE